MVKCKVCQTRYMLSTHEACPSCGEWRPMRVARGTQYTEFYAIIGRGFSEQERKEARMFADDLMMGSMDQYRNL